MEDERLVCVDLSRFRAKAGGSSPSRGLFENSAATWTGWRCCSCRRLSSVLPAAFGNQHARRRGAALLGVPLLSASQQVKGARRATAAPS